MKVNEIIEGVKNSVFVNEEVEKIAKERYEICKQCPFFSGNQDKPWMNPIEGPYYSKLRPDEHCTVCACNIHAKNRSLQSSCPKGKWGSVSLEGSKEITTIAAEGGT